MTCDGFVKALERESIALAKRSTVVAPPKLMVLNPRGALLLGMGSCKHLEAEMGTAALSRQARRE